MIEFLKTLSLSSTGAAAFNIVNLSQGLIKLGQAVHVAKKEGIKGEEIEEDFATIFKNFRDEDH